MRRLALLLIAMLILPVPAGAQDATPGALPVSPDPAECRATPRTAAEIDALSPGGFGTPAAADDARGRVLRGPSDPAPPDAVAGVEATAREFAACLSTRDFARLSGLYSDALIASGGFTGDQIDDQASAAPPGERASLLAVIEPRIFPDGRVAAIVIIDDPRAPSPVEPEFLVFAEIDGRWLVDDLPAYTAPPASAATPVAAGEATPAWGMVVPDPGECRIDPRDLDELVALDGTPGPGSRPDGRSTIPAWPSSTPADAETVAGIVATARELTACGNAGEPLRAASLYTDGFISTPNFSFNLPQDISVSSAPPAEQPGAVGVHYVRDFGDGRVGAVLALDAPESASPVYPVFFVFERVGDRWLIAGWPDTGFVEGSDDGAGVTDGTNIGATAEAIMAPTPTLAPDS